VQISIDRNGNRLVSVTKPERKKLTDALEFLAIVETNLGSSAAADARDSIRRVFKDLDNAVAATPKPTQTAAVSEINHEDAVGTPSVVAAAEPKEGDQPLTAASGKGGTTIVVGSHVTLFDGHDTHGGVVKAIYSKASDFNRVWCDIDADHGVLSARCDIVAVD
jgi:hypothetical protein